MITGYYCGIRRSRKVAPPLRFKVIHYYKEDYTYFTKEGLKCISVPLALLAPPAWRCVSEPVNTLFDQVLYTIHFTKAFALCDTVVCDGNRKKGSRSSHDDLPFYSCGLQYEPTVHYNFFY